MQEDLFTSMLHDGAEEIVESCSENIYQEQALLSPKMQKEKLVRDIETATKEVQKKIADGLKACLEAVTDESQVKKIKTEFEKISKKFNSEEAAVELGINLCKNISWKEHFSFPEEYMETLYQGAKLIFEKKDMFYAEKAFFFLTTVDPKSYAFWVALGHTSAELKYYTQAVTAYAMAGALDPENPWPHFWAAEVFLLEKNSDSAKMAFEAALSIEQEKESQDQKLLNMLQEKIRKITKK